MSDFAKVLKLYENEKGVIDGLSLIHDLPVSRILAVIAVETNDDDGFTTIDGDRKMIIRFEVHKFFKYVDDRSKAKKFFKYNVVKHWTGHKALLSGKFKTFHGNQKLEHRAFRLAKSIDSRAAHMSISMGLPQLMGFHYERLRYLSSERMFSDMSNGTSIQLREMFNFCEGWLITHLQNKNYLAFSKAYNGSGKAAKYAKLIEDAEKSLLVELKE